MSFDLNSVIHASETRKPPKIIIYSVHGLGKTTFSATFEKPIIARTEDGAAETDTVTFPNLISTFEDIESVISALHGDHGYKTLVIDTLDWLEPIVWAGLVKDQPMTEHGKAISHIDDYGYGKGYVKALDLWRYIMAGFDSLRTEKGMTIILNAHAEIKRYDSPETDPYDRYSLKLHRLASALWQEWADMVLFCNYNVGIKKADTGFGNTKTRGEGTGKRNIYTEERPAFFAKNRYGLPPKIKIGDDKTWSKFHEEFNKAKGE